MPKFYQHTQIGRLILFATLAIFAFFVFISQQEKISFSILFFEIFIILILLSFSTLQVKIDEIFLSIKFGYGIFKKRFALKEIASAQSVKNRWYYGWGIRMCPRPYMWIFNVSGFEAVEIVMKNGKRYRIGTDEPEKLATVIRENLMKVIND